MGLFVIIEHSANRGMKMCCSSLWAQLRVGYQGLSSELTDKWSIQDYVAANLSQSTWITSVQRGLEGHNRVRCAPDDCRRVSVHDCRGWRNMWGDPYLFMVKYRRAGVAKGEWRNERPIIMCGEKGFMTLFTLSHKRGLQDYITDSMSTTSLVLAQRIDAVGY